MTSSHRSKPALFTVWREIRRYGFRRSDCRFWLSWALIAAVLTFAVPFGQSDNIFQYLAIHIAFAGFGATVFGFTILGGKDDFFEPIIESVQDGVYALRNMVLFLFFPLILHSIACGLLTVRILVPQVGLYVTVAYTWRFLYGFIAIWATAQTAFSFHFLFSLAITRLVWKDIEVKKRKQAAADAEKQAKEQLDNW